MAGAAGHQPLRRCRVCRRQAPKRELTRWTVQGGVLVADGSRAALGRGYYTDSARCAEILPKTLKGVANKT